jgi:hypothetical protein
LDPIKRFAEAEESGSSIDRDAVLIFFEGRHNSQILPVPAVGESGCGLKLDNWSASEPAAGENVIGSSEMRSIWKERFDCVH